jgi:hypothetical protein
MGKGRIHHPKSRQRFEDLADGPPPHDGASFFFDLKLMLPDGMTAHDLQRARQTVEHRLQRTVRKKDRVVWTADGFFLLMATSHPARAGAAAERVHQDLCALLAGGPATSRRNLRAGAQGDKTDGRRVESAARDGASRLEHKSARLALHRP